MGLNIFSGLKVYGGKWSIKEVRKFSKGEIDMVTKAVVVSSAYGDSCCFFMKNGTTMYIPMSNDAASTTGDIIDLANADILTLCKDGEKDITRIRG